MARWRRGNAAVCPSTILPNGLVAKRKRRCLQNTYCRGSIPLQASTTFGLEVRDSEVIFRRSRKRTSGTKQLCAGSIPARASIFLVGWQSG